MTGAVVLDRGTSAEFAGALTRGQRHFLGVERSVTGRAWRERLDERGNARSLALVQRHGLPELLARIVAGRSAQLDGATDGVATYLDPTIKRLMPDPDVITDMSAAAQRIADALERGVAIAVLGDDVVDGATSAALMAIVSFGTAMP